MDAINIEQIMTFIHDAELLQAVALVVILAFISIAGLRISVPLLLETRTRIQKELEKTYDEHIEELRSVVDESRKERSDLSDRLVRQSRQLHIVNARLSNIAELLSRYSCAVAENCDGRVRFIDRRGTHLIHEECERCETYDCNDCEHASNLLSER